MDPLFSIVIPNYNSFHLMSKGIDSLKKQSYKNFEVIIVDDCSTDDSYQKLCVLADKTELNLRVFRQDSNQGPGAARNRGIYESKGEYITFIDADDFVEHNLLEQMLPYTKQGYDSVVFDALQDTHMASSLLQMVEKRNAMQGEISNREGFVFVRGGTWGKLYKSALIKENNIKFGEYYRSEDIPFTKSVIALSNKIFYLQKPLYHYVEVSTSIMHGGIWNVDEQNWINTQRIISEHIGKLDFEKELEAWNMRAIYPNVVFNMIREKKSNQEIKNYISTHFSNQAMKNSYLSYYPRSRYIMMKIISTGCIPVIKFMFFALKR